jgi:uncharacterized membrane protein
MRTQYVHPPNGVGDAINTDTEFIMRLPLILVALLCAALPTWAKETASELPTTGHIVPNLTGDPLAIGVIIALIIAYAVVVFGEGYELKKSIPVLIGAGVIWALVAIIDGRQGDEHLMQQMNYGFDHATVEIGHLTFFLVTAMTYVVTLQERNVFEMVRFKLLGAGLSVGGGIRGSLTVLAETGSHLSDTTALSVWRRRHP